MFFLFGKYFSFVEDGTASKVQKLLEERNSKEKIHWLQRWWDSYSYYSYRESVVINVSFTFNINHYRSSLSLLGDDPQLNRAVSLINLISRFEYSLWKKEIKNETFNGIKQCMGAFTKMFRSSRIPKEKEDECIAYQNPMEDSKPDVGSIIVIHKNQFYNLDVYDQNGVFLDISSLKNQLSSIINAPQSKKPFPLLGLLTADHRDNWYKAFQLLNKDETNRNSLTTIFKSLFVVCLDDFSPQSDDELANINLHGLGSSFSTPNRFFDKSVQLIVYKNGKAGIVGEHSAFDGAPTAYMADMVLSEEKVNDAYSKEIVNSPIQNVSPNWRRLEWNLTQPLLDCQELAKKNIDRDISNLSHTCFHFTSFGKNQIKKMKVSPDAFAQLAMQLAYYRVHNKVCPTYESCSTRKFFYGRTETMRTLSSTSSEWVNSMVQSDNKQKQLSLFLQALNNHQKLAREATEGNGCDRHLLGMRLIAKENNIKHPFLEDPCLIESSTWRLSTSQITVKHFWINFGPVVEDGYGICYGIFDDNLRFSISSFNSCPSTDSFLISKQLGIALKEMMDLLENRPGFNTKSNL